MGSTTSARPTFYEILGVSPAASVEEIRRAYGLEIVKPRAFGGLAEVGIAFATLTDAAKRRAYDEAIGIVRAPEPMPLHASWSWSVHVPAQPRSPAAEIQHKPPSVAPAAAPAAESPEPAESFIAASLRELADPAPIRPVQDGRVAPVVPTTHEPEPRTEPQLVEMQFNSGDAGAFEWRKPALVAGSLLLAAVLFGAWAGTAVRDSGESTEEEAGVTMAVPSAKARSASAVPHSGQEPVPDVTEERPARAVTPVTRIAALRERASERRAAPRPISLTPEEERELAGGAFAESAASQAPEAATAIAEVQTTPSQQVNAARLPLSERTVARTIGRIGYACGSVASITPVEGPTGVFKVTCTSGHAYQARPVRGRYHFRRWGRS